MKDSFWLMLAPAILLASAITVPDQPDVTAEIGVEAAIDQFKETASDVCENCNGTGKIGDGRIVMTCPVCRGTGKKMKSVLACENGKCMMP